MWRELPFEIVVDHIFQYLDELWLFRNARRVCREWNCVITGIRLDELNEKKQQQHYSTLGFKKLDGVDLKQNMSRLQAFYNCCKKGYFRNVRELNMGGWNDGYMERDERLTDLFNFLPNLTKLDVSCKPTLFNNNFGSVGCQALLEAYLQHLSYLNMNCCRLDGEAFSRLSLLYTVQYLHLSQTRLTEWSCCSFLSRGPLLEYVKELDLSKNGNVCYVMI